LEINRASEQPVSFRNMEFIRIGEVKKPLKDTPNRQRELWRVLGQTLFEASVALERVNSESVLRMLDYPSFFDLLQLPLPPNRNRILESLREDEIIQKCPAGGWNVTNLGAVLLAKNLADFPRLNRKSMRVIQYRGIGRIGETREYVCTKGYACGFEELVGHVNSLLPSTDVIDKALRRTVAMFPELAIRELVANALIHQDLHMSGAGPMVEIFDDRIEITNPGRPLVSTSRFVDTPPRSRNEVLASLMRRFRICEERGSGIDQVFRLVELFQLPAPLFEVPGDFTRVVLFAHKKFRNLTKRERIRACYFHACLCYVTRRRMTNASLRERFGVSSQNAAEVSRLLKDALGSKLIVVEDPSVGTRSRAYLPFWTNPSDNGTVDLV